MSNSVHHTIPRLIAVQLSVRAHNGALQSRNRSGLYQSEFRTYQLVHCNDTTRGSRTDQVRVLFPTVIFRSTVSHRIAVTVTDSRRRKATLLCRPGWRFDWRAYGSASRLSRPDSTCAVDGACRFGQVRWPEVLADGVGRTAGCGGGPLLLYRLFPGSGAASVPDVFRFSVCPPPGFRFIRVFGSLLWWVAIKKIAQQLSSATTTFSRTLGNQNSNYYNIIITFLL